MSLETSLKLEFRLRGGPVSKNNELVRNPWTRGAGLYKENIPAGERTNPLTGPGTGVRSSRPVWAYRHIKGGFIFCNVTKVGFSMRMIPAKYYTTFAVFYKSLIISQSVLLCYSYLSWFSIACQISYNEDKNGFPKSRKILSRVKSCVKGKFSKIFKRKKLALNLFLSTNF